MRNLEKVLGDKDGITFDPKRDRIRLNKQSQAVFNYMRDGEWHFLRDIASGCNAQETSVSARLRDLKKPQFGGFTVEKDHLGNGLWRYRLILPMGQLSLFGE